MATHIVLAELTESGRSSIDDLSADEESLEEAVGDRDLTIEGAFLTMGQYDLVVIVDAGSDEELADMLLEYAKMGIARTETMRAFPVDEFL